MNRLKVTMDESKKLQLLSNQGAILVVVLLILFALIILSISIATNLNTSMKIIANERSYTADVYQADSASTYTMNNLDNILNDSRVGVFDPNCTSEACFKDITAILSDAGIQDVTVRIRQIVTGGSPVDTGDSAVNFKINIFDIRAKKNSQEIQIGISKTYMKHEDNF